MEIKVNACLAKGQVVNPVPEGVLVVDTGGLTTSTFDGISGVDEACRKSISMGYVDHHSIDMHFAGSKQTEKKCATQMVVDHFDDILKYCKEHHVSEVQIHQDSDMDAITAAYLLREGLKNGELPKCAKQMAAIVNKVDYAEYRRPVDEYITSFPGCVEAIYSEISGAKAGAIFSNPENFGANHRLTDEAVKKLNQVDSETIKEIFPVYDALVARMEKNIPFHLDQVDIKSFIENSPAIDNKTKEYMKKGIEQIKQTQTQFEKDIETAEIVKFIFDNPETRRKEEGKIVIVESKDPLSTTNLGYARFGKNTIMAVYGGPNRKGGDMYDIGITPEAASMLGDVMKDICITMNKNEASKREQVERICEGLEQLTVRTQKEEQRLSGLRSTLNELATMGSRQAFDGADKLSLIDKDPSPLVAGNTLVPASRHSLITADTFKKALTNWANKTRTNELGIDNSIQR